MHKPYDYVIIGQGLAGSVLAWKLHQHGCRIQLLDYPDSASASRVAAGILNPVTGKRVTRLENTDALIASAHELYDELEAFFSTRFFHARNLLRIFATEDEKKRTLKRLQDPDYQDYLGELHEPDRFPCLNDPLGSVSQRQTGYLDIPGLLDKLANWFIEKEILKKVRVDYQEIEFRDQEFVVAGIRTRNIIFCEGGRAVNNPWFDSLPFQLTKGDVLSITTNAQLPEEFVLRGCWLLPVPVEETGKAGWKLGATYEHEFQDSQPDEGAKNRLLECLARLLGDRDIVSKIHIENHQAGIRPNTQDRYPFIGRHPDIDRLAIFNGFGSRGVLTIPFYAECLLNHLEKQGGLPHEVSVRRYMKKKQGTEGRSSLVQKAHELVSEKLKEGDLAVDATVGNGLDTVFLANIVGSGGKVIGFDIQEDALILARKRLSENKLENRVELHHLGHEYMERVIRPASRLSEFAEIPSPGLSPEPDLEPVTSALPKVIMFNLGYRPGSDKSVTTQPETTLKALSQSLALLARGGLVSMLIYRGHQGGQDEAKAIFNWLHRQDMRAYFVETIEAEQATDKSPVLIAITRS